jgi:hypothetical protein
MHRPSKADPSPDSPDFCGHVKCEHSGLALNMTARRRISIEVIYFFLEYWKKFMFFSGLSSFTEPISLVGYLDN